MANLAPEKTTEILDLQRHAEILDAVAGLRRHVGLNEFLAGLSAEQRHDIEEVQRLKVELNAISEAIQRTKSEIATLHYSGTHGREISRVTDELGAVVTGTEEATNSILEAAESIDDLAAVLASNLSGEDGERAKRIGERTIAIFEACNFQDITGQRISKVVTAMQFVEDRVAEMIRIWGGLESFHDVPAATFPDREGEKALLNGPVLVGDDSTSQDDIDAFFR